MPSICDVCPNQNPNPIVGRWEGSEVENPVMIVAEAPGREEVSLHKILIGPSGQLLMEWLKKLGYPSVYMTNVCKCPLKGEQQQAAARICSVWLNQEVETLQPRLLIPMGQVALDACISKARKISVERGRVQDSRWEIPSLATWHPAYLLRRTGSEEMEDEEEGGSLPVAEFKLDLTKALEYLVNPEAFLPPEDPQYRFIKSSTDLEKLVRELEDRGVQEVSLDVETTGLNWWRDRILCLGISWAPGEAVSIDFRSVDEHHVADWLKPFLETQKTVFHNAPFDSHFLREIGLSTAHTCVFDTQEAAKRLEENIINSLYNCLRCFTNIDPDYELEFKSSLKSKENYASAPVDKLLDYNCHDADYTLQLRHIQARKLEQENLMPLFEKQMEVIKTLCNVERRGTLIDLERLEELGIEADERIKGLQASLFEQAGGPFNPRSSVQLAAILYDKLHLPVLALTKGGKSKKRKPSTKKAVLKTLAGQSPFAKDLLDFRGLSKLQSTFLRGTEEEGSQKAIKRFIDRHNRIHTSFSSNRTVTARLASSRPNLQQIPHSSILNVRSMFIAPPGWKLIMADYERAEYWAAAFYSGDQNLLRTLQGGDFHCIVAGLVFNKDPADVTPEERFISKQISFGLLYGRGAKSLAIQLGITFREAAKFIEGYFLQFPILYDWMARVVAIADQIGYLVNIYGLKRRFFGMSYHERNQALNFLPQSTVGMTCNYAIVDIERSLAANGRRAGVTLNVHDAITTECPDEEIDDVGQTIVDQMTLPRQGFSMPVEVKVSTRWELLGEDD